MLRGDFKNMSEGVRVVKRSGICSAFKVQIMKMILKQIKG